MHVASTNGLKILIIENTGRVDVNCNSWRACEWFKYLGSSHSILPILLQYYSVLQTTTPVLQSTTPVLLRTTKYYSSTTPYYKVLLQYYKLLLQYYSVLQSTTPCVCVCLCACASASLEGQKLFGTTSETMSERRPAARTTSQPCTAPQGSAWPPFQQKALGGSSQVVSVRITSFRGLTNHGY